MPALEPKAYLVGFNLVKGIGAVRLRALLGYFGSAEEAWKAPIDALRAVGLPAKAIESLIKTRHEQPLEGLLERLDQQGIQVVTIEEEAYPRRLAEVDLPPPVLYVRGKLLPEDDMAIAVVGTRKMTAYGRQIAEELGEYLAANHLTLVSGLARGVDKVAHESVLKAGGRSIAVLGSGVDVIYPPEHARLAAEMMQHGAVVSDYPPGTQPDGVNFPPRNRIISGLSLATVVVEASEQSGSLITARFAAEQNRDVFAVPGQMYAPQSKGCNRLIRDGAHPLIALDEILSVLQLTGVAQKQEARSLFADQSLLTPAEAQLMQVLADIPQHMDELCAQSGLPIDQVSATLTLMELKGLVRQVGGMNFSIVREQFTKYRTDDDE